MSCNFQPESLLDLSLNNVIKYIITACYEINKLKYIIAQEELIMHVRLVYRPFIIHHVPLILREKMLSKCLLDPIEDYMPINSNFSERNLASVYMLNIMLDEDIKELRLNLGCFGTCSLKNALFGTIAKYGNGLNSLDLDDLSRIPLEPQLFYSLEFSIQNLTNLCMRFIASDEVLQVVGQSCFKLETLIVSHSKKVTDSGIKNLLQNQVDVIHRSQMQTTSRTWWHANNAFLTETLVQMTDGSIKKIDASFFEEHFGKPTKLCATLQTLDIGDTRVTKIGMLVALVNLKQLRTLGELCYIGNGLELLDSCTMTTPALRLAIVSSCHTTFSKFQTICNVCPGLKRLILTDPWLFPPMLCSLPATLTCLRLRNVKNDSEWVDGLYKFATGPHSGVLRELSVTFLDYDESLTMDLDVFMPRLVNLETLEIDGVQTAWRREPVAALWRLGKICLGPIDDPLTLRRLLKIAPGLEVLHALSCPGLSESVFTDLFDAAGPVAKGLKCVYVNDLPDGNLATAMRLIRSCPNLAHIGNVYSWNNNRFDPAPLLAWLSRNNREVQLFCENHWRHRGCVYLD